MLPISSTATQPAPAISPAAQASAAEADAVVPADAPPSTASVVDLSPVAQFLSNVSQARQQLNQLQAAVANGAAPSNPAEQASRLTDVAQRLVTAFNLLPAVDFNQGQQAARFAQQLSAASTSAAAALAPKPQPALTAEDLAANLRLDAARVELEQLASHPAPGTGADRLAAQRAAQNQLADTAQASAGQDRAATRAATQAANTAAAAAQQSAPSAASGQAATGSAATLAAQQATAAQSTAANLAGAIAAYNINDTARTTASGRAAQTSANAVQPVRRVDAVGAIDTGRAPPT